MNDTAKQNAVDDVQFFLAQAKKLYINEESLSYEKDLKDRNASIIVIAKLIQKQYQFNQKMINLSLIEKLSND